MRKKSILAVSLLAPALVLLPPTLGLAEETSPSFLQEHSGVRVLRGLSPETNFTMATLPDTVETAPATAPDVDRKPRNTRAVQAAIVVHRAGGHGIVVHRAGGHGQALNRLRHGRPHVTRIRVHRAGERMRTVSR